jgi:hypothetical protein
MQHFASLEAQGSKGLTVLENNMSLVYVDPDVWEVIWPGVTRIPEFDQPHITPPEKPRQILQYFPQGDSPHHKHP